MPSAFACRQRRRADFFHFCAKMFQLFVLRFTDERALLEIFVGRAKNVIVLLV